jgi:hypothetical protein
MRWQCKSCGDWHDGLPFSYGFTPPVRARKNALSRLLPPGRFSGELYRDNGSNFIFANLVLPVLDSDQAFQWTVWVTLSDETFERTKKLWTTKGRESELPYFGWLATEFPESLYPSTWNLKTHVITQPVGIRPHVELEPTDHPLSVEQREGITMARVQEFATVLMHPRR